jgi:hypothetical protein
MSRLRRQLVGLIAGQPYRFTDGIVVDVCRPLDAAALLPASSAPAVRAIREQG